MKLAAFVVLLLLQPYSAESQGATTCSGLKLNFPAPSTGECLTAWDNQKGQVKEYPGDFAGFANEAKIYRCPARNKRVIISNGIPDHQVTLQNKKGPCVINWVVEIPLNPTIATSRTEVPIRGMLAMALNGIPAYGPQESDSNNAVEGDDGVQGARFWYGHAGPNSAWHIHNPQMGEETVTATTLLGYAMDGFPIYGPLDDNSVSNLDPCNGIENSDGSYQYHVRAIDQVDGDLDYCNGSNPETNWNYILGCYSGTTAGSQVFDSTAYNLDTTDCVEEGTPTASPTQSPISQGTRPNIIVMQPDDLQFFDEWTRPPNNPTTSNKTINFPANGLPNIDSLRLDGLQMKEAYTASPVCGTSRYSTLTGKYPSRSGMVRQHAQENSNGDPALVTIPTTKLVDLDGINDCTKENIAVQFTNNGYRTGMIGKWHLSKIKDDEYTYAAAVDRVKQCGFSTVEGLYIENLASEGGFNNYSDGTFSHNMEWITYEAVQFINSQDEKPFFLYFNPTVPHSSNDVGDALTKFTCQDTANGKLGFDPVVKGMTEQYGNCADYRESIYNRADTEDDYGPIWLDDSVGAIITALEDKGILDNTIFLFQLDHGMETKEALYENGLRIPQFIHYPAKYSSGSTFDKPVSTIDIGATMLDFAGITPNYELDGVSWKDVSDDEDLETWWENSRCLFFELEQDRAVRCGCYKYLSIFEQTNTVSTTYKRGTQKELSNDLKNLFDLCDGTTDYVTDPTNNKEAQSVLNSDVDKGTELEAMMECHDTRTHYSSDPDFSACNLSPAPVAAPVASPVASPVAAPTGPCTGDSSTFTFPLDNAKTVECSWITKNSTKTADRKSKYCAKSDVKAGCCTTCATISAPVAAPVVAPIAVPVATPVVAPVVAPVAAPIAVPVATPVAAPTGPCTGDSSTFTFSLDNFAKTVKCSWITQNSNKTAARKSKYCAKSDVKAGCCASCA